MLAFILPLPTPKARLVMPSRTPTPRRMPWPDKEEHHRLLEKVGVSAQKHATELAYKAKRTPTMVQINPIPTILGDPSPHV